MLRSIGKQSGESAASVLKRAICIFTSFCYVTFVTFTSKAVTRVFEHPRNFMEKLDTQKQIYY